MTLQTSVAAAKDLRNLDVLTQELEAALVSRQSLRRTGLRLFAFNGSLVAMTCGVTPSLPFWYEINVYRTAADGWVSDIRLFNKADGSTDIFRVSEHADLDDLIDHLERYDPSGDLTLPRASADPKASSATLSLNAARLQLQIKQIDDHYRGLLAELLYRLECAAD